jgi:purine nucleosidase/pyrimidine-specific ribonucleoside hydrolase
MLTAPAHDTEPTAECQLTTPILIDTDPGIDDALAILLAFGSPEVSVEAITTVAGNVEVALGSDNILRILDVVSPAPRPRVAEGAPAPLRQPLVTAPHVHGADGLGNLDRFVEPDGSRRYPELSRVLEMLDGADLILQTVKDFPDRLVVVALGPLTNLALAIQRDPEALRRCARIVVMGGAVSVGGNVTPVAEFNMYVDPHAAAIVFEAGLPIDLVPLDVTRQVILTRGSLQESLGRRRGSRARFIEDFTLFGFEFGESRREGGIFLHDPLAMAVAIEPSLVGFESLHVAVEAEGRLTRGMTVADRRDLEPYRKEPPTCRAALSVDGPRFLHFFLERLCPASA